jgi:asparagine synthetase B (glutamine-hydrolysing)
MCGITGIYSPGQKVNEILVQEMRDILRLREPDDSGSYFETDIVMEIIMKDIDRLYGEDFVLSCENIF